MEGEVCEVPAAIYTLPSLSDRDSLKVPAVRHSTSLDIGDTSSQTDCYHPNTHCTARTVSGLPTTLPHEEPALSELSYQSRTEDAVANDTLEKCMHKTPEEPWYTDRYNHSYSNIEGERSRFTTPEEEYNSESTFTSHLPENGGSPDEAYSAERDGGVAPNIQQENGDFSVPEERYSVESDEDMFTSTQEENGKFTTPGGPHKAGSNEDLATSTQLESGNLTKHEEPCITEAMALTSYIMQPGNSYVTSSGESYGHLDIQDTTECTHPENNDLTMTEEHQNEQTVDDISIIIQPGTSNSIKQEMPESDNLTTDEEDFGPRIIDETPITTQPQSISIIMPAEQCQALTDGDAPIIAQPNGHDPTSPEAPCRTRAKRNGRNKRQLPESMRDIMIMPWSYDPCDDVDELHTEYKALCCKACCCPAWVFAENARKFGKDGCLWGLAYCFCPCVPGGIIRTKVREVRDIDGDPWDDCGLHWYCCCHWLSLVQETVEIKAFEADPKGTKRAIPLSRKKDRRHGTESSI